LTARRTDERSTADLFGSALALPADTHARWDLVTALHGRATPEVEAFAASLCRSGDASERRLGVDVLGQLGPPDRPFRETALPVLIACLDDPDDAVAAAAGVALGHHADLRAVDALVARAGHRAPTVRHGVVHGLSGLDDDRAITTLIVLSRDTDPSVRDWAVFGLGTQIVRDTPEIREALLARTRDVDPDVRGEALVGLARRGDARAIDSIREALAAGETGLPLWEAAALLGLVPPG
jgi:HEAT repeat protein